MVTLNLPATFSPLAIILVKDIVTLKGSSTDSLLVKTTLSLPLFLRRNFVSILMISLN